MTKKQTIVAAAAIIIVCGVFYYLESATAPTIETPNLSITATPTETGTERSAPDDSSGADNSSDLPAEVTPSGDISDTALDKDMTNIDRQLGNLESDTASIDNGLNDQPLATE